MASVMAGICRTGCRFVHRISSNNTIVRQNLKKAQCCAYSSTTKKSESEFVIGKRTEYDPKLVEELRKEDFRDPRIEITDPEDPQYEHKGYYKNAKDDAWASKVILTSTLSIAFVGLVFYIWYLPDLKQREWAKREAFRLIERKTAAGEEVFINPDFIPMDKLVVPTDEEMEAVMRQ